MIYRWLADGVVVVHGAFVVFVIIGGFLALRWPRIVWVHLPAAIWGVLIEFAGWICPLTPLENSLRVKAGQAGYEAGFIEHYLLPLLYPGELTLTVRIVLGLFALAVNVVAYTLIVRRWRRTKNTVE